MLPSHIILHSQPAPLLTSFLQGKTYSSVAVLVDENTEQHCYPIIESSLPRHKVIRVPAGEEHKNLATCTYIWQKLTDLTLDRHSLLIILGGGVLGDMGGFCACTYKRGIDFVLMPTTLLAQVDASVGGKLGIDFQDLKNHIGIFQEPKATLIATHFLNTLPERELRSGFAEIIKHCITFDEGMWNAIRAKSLHEQDWHALVRHSVECKWKVVKEDPREAGLRKVLNFGHTVGHAVEGYFLGAGNRILHGEAIAIGMICESYLASRKGKLSGDALAQISGYICRVFGKVPMPSAHHPIWKLMSQDKKNRENKVLMALPEGVGSACWDVEISEKEAGESLSYYDSLYT